jgi:translation initiation factor IF-3
VSRRHRRKKYSFKANQQIRYPKVRVIDEDGEMVDIMPSKEAYRLAKRRDKDLVLITDKAKPPVTKIIEKSKYKYQLQQKRAKARKSNRAQQTKEVRFSMFMGDGDLKARTRRVKRFLKDGDKVRMTLLFKGRQITKKKFAYELFADVIDEVDELAEIENRPKIQGRKLVALLRPE